VLAHLMVLITAKLRRGERFSLAWQHPDELPGGRSTLWMDPAISLCFVFDSPTAPQLNRKYLEELASAAASSGVILLAKDQVAPPDS